MIEPAGPWGIHPSKTLVIRVLAYLSDGEWRTTNEIAEYVGGDKVTILNILKHAKSGLMTTHGVQMQRIDDPADSKQMIAQYRYKLSLRPCPWDNSLPKLVKSSNRNASRYWVGCQTCGIKSAMYSCPSEAVWAWNRRFGE